MPVKSETYQEKARELTSTVTDLPTFLKDERYAKAQK
jgi:hypothetical protein